jgi:aspartokinase
MANTREIVERTIERDGAIRTGLARKVLNVRAVARLIQKESAERGEEIDLDALISAIRRYPIGERTVVQKSVERLLLKLTMKNRIIDIAILNDPKMPAALGAFASQIDYSRGETLRIVAGVETIRVVIDEKNLDKLRRIIPKENIKKVVHGLAEIIVSMSEVAEKTPGVVSTVTTELAMNGINMIEFMSCVPELVIVVDEADALRSYESLQELSTAHRQPVQ